MTLACERMTYCLVACIVFSVCPSDVHAQSQADTPQSRPALGLPPAPMAVPHPGPATDQPYAPQAILPGGVVVTLWPSGSKYVKADRVKEAEQYNMSQSVPGRVNSIVNIHNPSIEFHPVDGSLNTGAVVILAAGGGHNTLNVGTEAADFVPFFYQYGINSVILRNRLRRDGYNPKTDEVYDALQAIRLVRAYAKQWKIDPNKLGIMGFSAGAELATPAAIRFEEFDKANNEASDPLAGVTSRPDFVGVIYPGPSPFARGAKPGIPKNAPPAFIMCAGAGDRQHAVWADEYFAAMLAAGIPNVEMHIYGNGHHPGSGSTGGLTDRAGTPMGTWQFRFVDWFRDLGFMQKPGVKTRAAEDVEAFVRGPAPGARGGRRGSGAGTRPGQ